MIGRTNTGGGGGGLNFKVVAGTTQPNSPKENMIWLVTDAEMTNWVFSAKEPSAESGTVWIKIGTASAVAFNALKKNCIQICPISASMYTGGEWVDIPAKSYQGGEWVEWIVYLYNAGNEFTTITGGISTAQANATVTKEAGSILFVGKKDTDYVSRTGCCYTTSPIDISGYGTLTAVVDVEHDSEGVGKIKVCALPDVTTFSGCGYSTYGNVSGAERTEEGSAVEVSLDVSNMTGEYYLGVFSNCSSANRVYSLFLTE